MRDRGVMSLPLRRVFAHRVRSYDSCATRTKRQNPFSVGAHPVRDCGVMSFPLSRVFAHRVSSYKTAALPDQDA